MNSEDIEIVYDAVATTLDHIGTERQALYLAKLVLLLAKTLGDRQRALACIADAAENLDV